MSSFFSYPYYCIRVRAYFEASVKSVKRLKSGSGARFSLLLRLANACTECDLHTMQIIRSAMSLIKISLKLLYHHSVKAGNKCGAQSKHGATGLALVSVTIAPFKRGV